MIKLQAAHELRTKLEAQFGNNLDSLVLFGTVAKGTDTSTSDLDLYAITTQREVVTAALKILSKFPFPVSFVAETPDQFQHYLSEGDPFSISLVYSGVELIGRETTFTKAQIALQKQPITYQAQSVRAYLKGELIEQCEHFFLPLEQVLNKAYNGIAVAAYHRLLKGRTQVTSEELNAFGDKKKLRAALVKISPEAIANYDLFVQHYYNARKKGAETTIGELNHLTELAFRIIEECT